MKNQQALLTTEQAADFLCISKSFLEKDRWRGAKIKYVVIGTRTIRYQRSVLEAYLDQQVRTSTSDTGELK